MNKKLLVGSCGLAAVAGNMFADENVSYFNPYASLKGGYAFLGKRDGFKYKGGFAGAVELGVSYDAWRMGLELGYKSNKVKEYTGKGAFEGWLLQGKIATADMATMMAARDYSIFKYTGATAAAADLEQNHWYLKDAIHISKINALTGMVNVFYDYAMTEAWSCYAGVGLGVAKVAITVDKSSNRIDLDCNGTASAAVLPANVQAAAAAALKGISASRKIEFSKTVFAWQVMAGVGYEFNENWKLTLGYKLFNTAKVKTLGNKEIKTPFNHTIEAGLNYTF